MSSQSSQLSAQLSQSTIDASAVVPARRQGIIWIATVPESSWEPCLPDGIRYLKGQLEEGESGYRHWQFIFYCEKKASLASVKCIFPRDGHYELTRSAAAEEYVEKVATRAGEKFEFGTKPFQRSRGTDWETVRRSAMAGDLSTVPADIFVRYYFALRSISSDSIRPVAQVRKATVFWGPTGTGKSRRAWDEAGPDAFSKDPRSKFWDCYNGEANIVVDEFRGGIDIAHILR